MTAIQSKTAFLYSEVRRALRSGPYVPGQRIDPATIAEEFHASATPVRFALYRLVGEGLIVDHARTGLYVPLPTEVALRDLYDWMRRLLLMACDIGMETTPATVEHLKVDSTEKDVAEPTWELFEAIARATDHRFLHQAVAQPNNRLAPVRRIGLGLVDDTIGELAALIRCWQDSDLRSHRSGLKAYHERRKQLVPQTSTFQRVRRYIPVDTCCLPDSLAFSRFLARRGFHSNIVFGVTCDPSGGVACIHSVRDGTGFVTSDISIASRLKLYERRIDWDFVAHFLAHTYVKSERTTLSWIRELLPGCTLRVHGRETSTSRSWSPWDFVAPARRHAGIEDAALELRTARPAGGLFLCRRRRAHPADQGIPAAGQGEGQAQALREQVKGSPGITSAIRRWWTTTGEPPRTSAR